MSESALLQIRDLCVSYRLSQVLFNVTLAVPRHGAVAVLGRNGAGKSTLLKTIVGEIAPRSGSIVLNLQDITLLPTERRIQAGLGYAPQEHSVFNRLSVRENLEVGALANQDRLAIDQVLAWFPKLGQRLDQVAGTLSGGERKMLAIGRAISSSPRLLLLDEPTEGLWIGVVEEIAGCLRDLVKDIAVVIVEQHLELALGVADYAYVLDRGRVALEGRSAAVRNDPTLLQLLAP
ncbi:ABC transporter ATP-binding protein [Bradyrhizobium sp. CB82]|uniref:ABC transporter ATP-binding protein n=1 Tax=Bradyrhizobium sp. CB82 TaxID=3039159 RepID=UPI0024B0C497|nr:ABC transporter ATP-binding protein [Bradyrhizobium sp. CB82]WFU39136.1 ABC transporter ATP-binding protein [Bradyrhizobium sp. CB82]